MLEFFVGMNVITNYGDTFKRYRIEDIDFNQTPSSPFPDKKFKDYKDYYLKTYKNAGKITVENQFMLVSSIITQEEGQKIIKPVHLVPELLRKTGMTQEQKQDFRVMKEIANETVVNPDRRMNRIKQNIDQKINQQSSGLQIDMQDNKVNAYQMPKPSIVVQGKSMQLKGDRIMIKSLAENKSLDEWVVVHDFRIKEINQIIESLIESGSRY